MTDRPETSKNPETDDVQALWQGQDQENPAMTLQAIRMLVRNDRDHMRQQLVFGLIVVGVEVLVFASMVRTAKNDLMRWGAVVVILGLGWMTWRLMQRWPGRAPEAGATTKTLIEFQKQALMRRRGGYGWLLASSAPVIVGAAMVAVGAYLSRPGAPIANLAPFAILLVVWFVWGWFINRRGSRRLQEQIDDLDQMARG